MVQIYAKLTNQLTINSINNKLIQKKRVLFCKGDINFFPVSKQTLFSVYLFTCLY